jgi:hypothetical protein
MLFSSVVSHSCNILLCGFEPALYHTAGSFQKKHAAGGTMGSAGGYPETGGFARYLSLLENSGKCYH